LVGLSSPSSHFGCHFFSLLEVLKPYHSGVTRLYFLILNNPIFPDNLLHFLLIELFNHLEKLLPLFLIYPRKVPFLHCLLYVPLCLLLLLERYLPFYLPRIDVVVFPIVVGLILVVDLLVLQFEHFLQLLHSFSTLSVSLSLYLFVFFLVILYTLKVNLKHRVSLAHDFLSPFVLLLSVSTVVVLLYLFEKRWLLSHTFGYDLVLFVPFFPL
jgi:hypothetical protein